MVFFTVIFYFASFTTIKLINYHLRRKETLKVVRLYDSRYLMKELLLKLREYILSSDSVKHDIISFALLFLQLFILYLNLVHLWYGSYIQSMLIVSSFLFFLLMACFVDRKRNDNTIQLVDNHLILNILFFVFLLYLPDVSATLIGVKSTFFSIGVFVLSITLSFQSLWFVKRLLNLKFKSMFSTMHMFLILITMIGQVYIAMDPGLIKMAIVMAHGILISAILLSYKLNTVELKSFKKNRNHAYALCALSFLFIGFVFGGILWS